MWVPSSRRIRFVFAVLLVVSTGCIRGDRGVVILSPGGTRAMLAAARANQISMFGDLPQVSPTAFTTRASVSLIQHTFSEVGADFDPDIEPGGRRIVFASTRHSVLSDLYIKNTDGVAVTQLSSDPSSDIQPSFSPDGRRVAFASNRTGNWDIWIISVDGGAPVQVTNDPGDDVHASWSPDGNRLVFCSLPANGGQWELWTADARAGANRRFIGYGLFPSWSPVDDTILFQRARERGSRWFSVWTLELVDGEPRYPTEVASSAREAVILPAWSTDGKRIAYASSATLPAVLARPDLRGTNEAFDIWVMDTDGRNKIRLTDGHTANFAPTFADDGRIFFVSSRSGHENIWSLRPGTVPGEAANDGMTTTDARRMDATMQQMARPVSTRGGS